MGAVLGSLVFIFRYWELLRNFRGQPLKIFTALKWAGLFTSFVSFFFGVLAMIQGVDRSF
jgi:hypothetical protein